MILSLLTASSFLSFADPLDAAAGGGGHGAGGGSAPDA